MSQWSLIIQVCLLFLNKAKPYIIYCSFKNQKLNILITYQIIQFKRWMTIIDIVSKKSVKGLARVPILLADIPKRVQAIISPKEN